MAINNNIIVGLDIGTTKVCAIVGQMAENGKVKGVSLAEWSLTWPKP
jgi:cell division ATPase FtsA